MRAPVHRGAWASRCVGFPCCGAQALEAHVSVVAVLGLCRCGLWAELLLDMWDLPRSEINLESPALAGGFLPTVPPGKSQKSRFVGKTHRWEGW